MFWAALIVLTLFWTGWAINHILDASARQDEILRNTLQDIDIELLDEELDHA
jgi:hypothetical protein